MHRRILTDEQAFDAVYNAFLEHSRREYCFPKVHNVERKLGIHMKSYEINSREIKVKAIKQRLKEIYSQNPNVGEKGINKLLGIGIFGYLEDLGVKTISELRKSYAGKESKRGNRSKFDTKEDAMKAFRTATKEMIVKGEYKGCHYVEKKVGANAAAYGIKWSEEILYSVYGELIGGELRIDPKLEDKEIEQRYSFAKSFLEKQGGLSKFKENNEIQNSRNEEDILLDNLILQAVKFKPETRTSRDEIERLVEEKTGKYADTTRLSKEIEHLKRIKKIEGNMLIGGYLKVG